MLLEENKDLNIELEGWLFEGEIFSEISEDKFE
jgi:hypothetical protein